MRYQALNAQKAGRNAENSFRKWKLEEDKIDIARRIQHDVVCEYIEAEKNRFPRVKVYMYGYNKEVEMFKLPISWLDNYYYDGKFYQAMPFGVIPSVYIPVVAETSFCDFPPNVNSLFNTSE